MSECIQTRFRVIFRGDGAIVSNRLTVLFSPDGQKCRLHLGEQREEKGGFGYGAEDLPNGLLSRLKDRYNGYAAYTLTPEKALEKVVEFQKGHPEVRSFDTGEARGYLIA